jgi:hypothetical protein
MKLAAALQERADINSKIEELRERLNRSVLVQEGETPVEDPKELKAQIDSLSKSLIFLIGAINKTNSLTKIGDSTITQLIAKKDVLTLKVGVYRDIIDTAASSTRRARGTEIKIQPVISVKDWQKEADEIAKEVRFIDNTLQETNWNTELIE